MLPNAHITVTDRWPWKGPATQNLRLLSSGFTGGPGRSEGSICSECLRSAKPGPGRGRELVPAASASGNRAGPCRPALAFTRYCAVTPQPREAHLLVPPSRATYLGGTLEAQSGGIGCRLSASGTCSWAGSSLSRPSRRPPGSAGQGWSAWDQKAGS